MKSLLKLEVVWKDDDMFELEVTASNGQFSGTTEVYDVSDTLCKFANSLKGFPQTKESVLLYEAGQKDSRSYFAMKFYAIDKVGHLGVQVNLEKYTPSSRYRTEEKDKLVLEILTEPGLLDRFVGSLIKLAENEDGHATLEGLS